ncbi:MAG: ParB/RepB/Spo0J family partition protein [Sphingomonas sp.]|uniref:ParB/RepB/Spo0J family partition protein n=1 Tax=Sphingomonas sp. TaxID=28214 RepID=UPI003F7E08DA
MTERRDKPSFASLFNRARAEAEAPQSMPVPAMPAETAPPVEPRRRDEWAYEAMQFLVDPARVRIWPGNARIYEDLSPDNCRDLIQSIATEGMQKVAAIVRPVFDDALYEYEVIAGTRRHFAVSYLRATSMPSLRFLIQVEILDDEAAFRLADLENRARKDVSDIERARNYAAALHDHYAGHLTRMAERLALSKSWLSKMIRVSALPDQLLAAFGSPGDLHLKPAYTLAQKIDGPAGPLIMATAAQIARAQAARRVDGLAPYPAAEVLRQLNAAAAPSPEDAAELRGPTGRLAMTANANKNTLTLKLHAGSGVTRKAITDAVRAALVVAETKGFSLGLAARPEDDDAA